MCGIIGAVNFNTPLRFPLGDLAQQMKRMHYRGPDAQVQWIKEDNKVRLGHLRLSILDPNPLGNQPMHLKTGNGNLSMVFNGEIYNYLEIKEKLIALGYTFKTGTDSEVVISAFAAWGEDCIKDFNGMFAIAIYNDENGELFLARDRIGIKPLYYSRTEDGIIFASEVKAIKGLLPFREHPLKTHLLHEFMDYGYTTGEETLDKDIFRLLPGQSLKIKNKSEEKAKYWNNSRPKASIEKSPSFDEKKDEFLSLFSDSINLQLHADVPVGVFLSGGLDSSAVVAMIARNNPSQKIKTFSVRYDIDEYGDEYDESVYAEQVAKHFGTDHHTYTMTADDFKNYIPDFVRAMDEPVTEAAAISLHFVSELAKEKVTVVLSGEGSDEMFGGYELYQNMIKLEKIRKTLTPALTNLISSLSSKLLPNGNKVRKYIELAALPFEERYRGISVYDKSHKESLYKIGFSNMRQDTGFSEKTIIESRGQSTLSRMLDFDTKTWLVDDLLIKADRMSMASSLELRVPFLDHRIVEFAAALPDNFKINNGSCKYILKEAMRGLLPDNIIDREKRGFPTPLARMFKSTLRPYVESQIVCSSAKINEIFAEDYVKSLFSEHVLGKADHHRILWQLLVLEEWLQQNSCGDIMP